MPAVHQIMVVFPVFSWWESSSQVFLSGRTRLVHSRCKAPHDVWFLTIWESFFNPPPAWEGDISVSPRFWWFNSVSTIVKSLLIKRYRNSGGQFQLVQICRPLVTLCRSGCKKHVGRVMQVNQYAVCAELSKLIQLSVDCLTHTSALIYEI